MKIKGQHRPERFLLGLTVVSEDTEARVIGLEYLSVKVSNEYSNDVGIVELNLAAGKRAKASSVYATALRYLTASAALFPERAWEPRQELVFELELHSVDCEMCMGALQTAEERLAMLAVRAATMLQRRAAARRRVELYTMLGDSDRAVAAGLESLRHVGIDWPVILVTNCSNNYGLYHFPENSCRT